jgi:hypothetical protein
MKTSERKWSERKRNLHPLVTMDTDSFSREASNKRSRPVILLMMNNFLTNYNKSKGFTAHVGGFTTFKNLLGGLQLRESNYKKIFDL